MRRTRSYFYSFLRIRAGAILPLVTPLFLSLFSTVHIDLYTEHSMKWSETPILMYTQQSIEYLFEYSNNLKWWLRTRKLKAFHIWENFSENSEICTCNWGSHTASNIVRLSFRANIICFQIHYTYEAKCLKLTLRHSRRLSVCLVWRQAVIWYVPKRPHEHIRSIIDLLLAQSLNEETTVGTMCGLLNRR